MSWATEVERHGRDVSRIQADLQRLREGVAPLDVVRACTRGDGICTVDARHEALGLEVASQAGAFVPASGAATRLFQGWRAALESGERLPSLAQVSRLAAWEGGGSVADGMEATMARWEGSPKGLIPFHAGGRTAVDEHVAEADALGLVRLHFTVGAEHVDAFLAATEGAAVEVSVSVQDPRTDTLCFTGGLEPLRDGDGQLVFRPGGHGALLGNLEAFGGRYVLIKNIDNVVAAPRRPEVVRWRRRLLGRAAELRAAVCSALEQRDAQAAQEVLAESFGVVVPRDQALLRLDRPFRVAAMVLDEGQPGGGPFWVRGSDGLVTPQIVEGAQLDMSRPSHRAALQAATHFHPVDMVLCLEGPAGRWRADGWSDEQQSLIVHKRHLGHPVVALERPGLWNGGMAGFHTCFVEVPAATFQPVKRIDDLLRRAHQGSATAPA